MVRTHFLAQVLLGFGCKQAISQPGGNRVVRDRIGSLPTRLHALDTGAGSALGLREQDAWEREAFGYGACITCCTLYMCDVCHPIPTHHSTEPALSWPPFTEKGFTGKKCAEYLTVSHPGNKAVACALAYFHSVNFSTLPNFWLPVLCHQIQSDGYIQLQPPCKEMEELSHHRALSLRKLKSESNPGRSVPNLDHWTCMTLTVLTFIHSFLCWRLKNYESSTGELSH